jgi:hypothetical protein
MVTNAMMAVVAAVAVVAADFKAEATMVIVGKPTRPDQLFVTSVDDLTPLGTGGTVLDTGKPHSDLRNLCDNNQSTSKFPLPPQETNRFSNTPTRDELWHSLVHRRISHGVGPSNGVVPAPVFELAHPASACCMLVLTCLRGNGRGRSFAHVVL